MNLPEVTLNADGDLIATPSSAEVLADLLVTYEDELRRAAPSFCELLNPGLAPDQIRSMLAEIDITASDELVTWFSWHNGRHYPEDVWAPELHPFFRAVTLEGSIAAYESSVAFQKRVGTEGVYNWKKGWVGISDASVGFMVSSTGDSPDAPSIVQFCDEENYAGERGTLPWMITLCPLVTWWIEALRNGAATENGGGWTYDASKLTPLQRSSRLI